MKKKCLVLLTAVCMLCMTAACGKEEAVKSEKQETEESTSEAAVDMEALGSSTVSKLGNYKGLTYVPREVSVTEEEVLAYVDGMLESAAEEVEAETATETSIVNIDYVGKKDGVAFEGGTAEGTELDIANSHFIPGFAESIVGMKVGETKDCPMTFPEDYHSADLAGQEVVFTITVNNCRERILPEVEEFAVNEGYENAEKLYDAVEEMFLYQLQQEADAEKEYQLIEKLIADSEFEIDEKELEVYIYQVMGQQEQLVYQYYGIDLETYVTAYLGMTMEAFEIDCEEAALFRLQNNLLKREIAKVEGIEISEEAYETGIANYMTVYGYTDKAEFEETFGKEELTDQLLIDAATDLIMEHATAEE